MKPLSLDFRQELEEATAHFELALRDSPTGADYLKGRGFTGTTAQEFRLGWVPQGVPGWEQYAGMVSIPNINADQDVVGMKFRNLEPDSKMKYTGRAGEVKRLFNTRALTGQNSTVAITEGEFDAIACGQAGIPAVSVGSGASSWKRHHSRMFAGYTKVWIVADDDDPGKDLATKLLDALPMAELVTMPEGCKDINDVLKLHGEQGVRERMSE